MNNHHDALLQQRLNTLFNSYQSLFPEGKCLEICKRGFSYSLVNHKADVLVMGINPSLRTDFLDLNRSSYRFEHQHDDRYFKKIHQLIGGYNHFEYTYADLFYQRHTQQRDLSHFMATALGRHFLRDQMIITLDLIKEIKPKIILVFNRQAGSFFHDPWLGFDFQASDLEHVFRFRESEKNPTALYNTRIYFSEFIGYRTPKLRIARIKSTLEAILTKRKQLY